MTCRVAKTYTCNGNNFYALFSSNDYPCSHSPPPLPLSIYGNINGNTTTIEFTLGQWLVWQVTQVGTTQPQLTNGTCQNIVLNGNTINIVLSTNCNNPMSTFANNDTYNIVFDTTCNGNVVVNFHRWFTSCIELYDNANTVVIDNNRKRHHHKRRKRSCKTCNR